MSRKRDRSDSRLNVARYQVERLIPAEERVAGDADAAASEPDNAGQSTMEARSQYVEILIQQAMRRGEFDDLPGAGKPITDLHLVNDPDWWIRRKIERENITGLGPPALTLRTENQQLDERLDAQFSEKNVREILEEFNKRVINARRQLQGGPPVVTPTRDVEMELERWRQRRASRLEAARQQQAEQDAARSALSWRERRRAKRGRP